MMLNFFSNMYESIYNGFANTYHYFFPKADEQEAFQNNVQAYKAPNEYIIKTACIDGREVMMQYVKPAYDSEGLNSSNEELVSQLNVDIFDA